MRNTLVPCRASILAIKFPVRSHSQAQIEDTRHPSTSVNGDVEEAAFRRRGALTPAHWPDLSPLPPARHSPPAQDRFPQLTPEPPPAHSGLGMLELSLRDAQPRTSSFFVVFT
ncbi:hypothetical protein FB45DRAFT_1028395 [Roridomyces roridus]|uniref:Uncharacterized protein n=1 Tax=Roridomyces roridus TaxID=1738132 RepID=A0AAD7FJS0_9AGAR|nr:hypothetical protein FB45DRAFT_1028395 [Roridomyces roridus]